MYTGDFMTKIILIPSTKQLDYDCDAYLLGIENLSVNMPIYYNLEEIKKIKTQKEIFISLNKNMHASDLKQLEQTLKELEKLNIKGIFFYDIGVLNIIKRLNLKIDLVLAEEHSQTNYETINYWYQNKVKYAQIPSEINIKEIKKIKQNTKAQLIIPILGYQPMFVSKRHLIKNYLEHFNQQNKSQINYIKKEQKIYPIIDEKVTTVYTNAYLNGIKEYTELKENNIEYVLINSLLINKEDTKKIIDKFKKVDKKNKEEYNNDINNILNNNIDTFFLHKETIYKVK